MKNILVHFSFLPTRTFIKNSKSQGLAELAALHMKIEYHPPPHLLSHSFSLSYSHCSSLLLRFADQQQKKREKQFMRSLTCDLISFLLLITVNL